MIRVSVIVATYNRAPYLLRTLGSLAVQDFDPECFEVVVVDNNSKDGTAEAFASFAADHPQMHLRMVTETSQGISYARNRGIAEAAGEYVVFIDDDELASAGLVRSYCEFFDSRPQCEAAGGAVVPRYEAELPRWYSHYIEKMITGALDMGGRIVPFRGARYPGVGNSGFRKRLFERYGAFDPALGRTADNPLGGEEKDFFARMRRHGLRYYYLPGAAIEHLTPASKLSEAYFDRLSKMIGKSERIRTRSCGKRAYADRLLQEAVKWGGALTLALGYLFTLHPLKGWYLIRMRWNITGGLLGRFS